jgi:hypothetical protein
MEVDRSNRRINADWCSELTPGGTPYFTVAYPEPGVNIPEVETLIYLGSTEVSDDEGGQPCIGFLFQEAHSYLEDGEWSTLPDAKRDEMTTAGTVMIYNEGSVGHVADIDGLLVLLNDLREHMRRGLGWDRYIPDED